MLETGFYLETVLETEAVGWLEAVRLVTEKKRLGHIGIIANAILSYTG
jgi:hypothetical protein